MKRMKKFISLLLAVVMVFAMAGVAFADTGEETQAGSITIKDASNVSVAERTFYAYKILDVDSYSEGNKVVYSVPSEMKTFYQTRYDLTGDESNFDEQVVEKINEENDMFAFAAAALEAAKAVQIKPGTKTAETDDKSVTIENLPLGYYVVEDHTAEGSDIITPVSALILNTLNPNVTIEIKADKPSVDKKIDGDKDTDDSTTNDVENNNAAVGDKVPYKVTSKVPDMIGYEKYYYVVNDTLSKGLTFNDDVKITIGMDELTRVYYAKDETDDAYYYYKNATYNEETKEWTYSEKLESSEGEESPKIPEKAYIVEISSENDETKVEISFVNFIQYKSKKGNDITITYSATINENAVIGTAGNDNKVTLTYSNNPNEKPEDDPENPDKPNPNEPVGETPESTTRTYVTGVELTKVDQNNNRLTGAEFKIEGTKINTVLVTKDTYVQDDNGTYWKLNDGTYTTNDPATEGMDQSKYENTTVKYKKIPDTTPVTKTENVQYTGTVGDDGILRFDGLSAGTYTITELKAPNGYNLLKKPIQIQIVFTVPEKDKSECKWSATDTSSDEYITSSPSINSLGIIEITVKNQSGTELPETGGAGTTMFYLIGGILAVGAAVLLVTKRRMRSEE